jgi:hypothetical protein
MGMYVTMELKKEKSITTQYKGNSKATSLM